MGPLKTLSSFGIRGNGSYKSTKTFSLKKLQRFSKAWIAIESAVELPPKTVLQWSDSCIKAQRALARVPKAPRLQTDYFRLWHIRGLLRDRMQMHGIKCLKLDNDITVYKLLRMNPDQSLALSKIQQFLIQQRRMHNMSALEFIKALGSPRHPELLSMWFPSCSRTQRCSCIHTTGDRCILFEQSDATFNCFASAN